MVASCLISLGLPAPSSQVHLQLLQHPCFPSLLLACRCCQSFPYPLLLFFHADSLWYTYLRCNFTFVPSLCEFRVFLSICLTKEIFVCFLLSLNTPWCLHVSQMIGEQGKILICFNPLYFLEAYPITTQRSRTQGCKRITVSGNRLQSEADNWFKGSSMPPGSMGRPPVLLRKSTDQRALLSPLSTLLKCSRETRL